MTISNFNYEGSYLPGVICIIVVNADLHRPPGTSIPQYWCLVVKNGNFKLLLTYRWSRNGNWQIYPPGTDILWSGMAISHCCWHIVVKNDNFTLLLISSEVKNGIFTLLLTYFSQGLSISHCYWHLVVKNGNFTLLLISCGQEWEFHIATDILWSWMEIATLLLTSWWTRMAMSHCY